MYGSRYKFNILSLIIGLALGALFGVLRTSKSRLVKMIFRLYLEFLRLMQYKDGFFVNDYNQELKPYFGDDVMPSDIIMNK